MNIRKDIGYLHTPAGKAEMENLTLVLFQKLKAHQDPKDICPPSDEVLRAQASACAEKTIERRHKQTAPA